MQYERGQSGNPAGRPVGIKDKWLAKRGWCQHAEELVAKVVEMAKTGDTTALRICIDRVIPPMNARDEPVSASQGLVGPGVCDERLATQPTISLQLTRRL